MYCRDNGVQQTPYLFFFTELCGANVFIFKKVVIYRMNKFSFPFFIIFLFYEYISNTANFFQKFSQKKR